MLKINDSIWSSVCEREGRISADTLGKVGQVKKALADVLLDSKCPAREEMPDLKKYLDNNKNSNQTQTWKLRRCFLVVVFGKQLSQNTFINTVFLLNLLSIGQLNQDTTSG